MHQSCPYVADSCEVNGRSITGIMSEMKEEAKYFVQTRIAMLKQEIQEKLARLKIAALDRRRSLTLYQRFVLR